MERKKRCIRSLSKKDTKEEDDTGVHIDDLPEEMFLKILGYLKYDELSRAGSVCKKWYALSRCPFLWKQVDVFFTFHKMLMSEKAMKFLGVLPAYVTHLKLNFEISRHSLPPVRKIAFRECLMKVTEKCPNLQVLIFHRAALTTNEPSFAYDGLLANVRALVFHQCLILNPASFLNPLAEAKKRHLVDELVLYHFISKLHSLENLCLAGSHGFNFNFSYYPSIVSRLKVLDLEDTVICLESFPALLNYGHQLVELYICFTIVSDDELDFTKSSSITAESLDSESDDKLDFTKSSSVLPCLKTVCLRWTLVTCRGVSSLLKSCENLQCIYVGDRCDYANCNSKKVQVHDGLKLCNHYANNTYMYL